MGPPVGAAVIEHGVTGDLLESYETKEELLSLGITSLADTKRMDLMTKAMKQRHTGAAKSFAGAPSLPASDHELVALRALNRYGFTQDYYLLMGNPWLATWWFNRQAAAGVPNALHLFDQHPKSAQFSWTYWLLFPEWMVVKHWYGFTDTDPILAYGLILAALAFGVLEWFTFLALCSLGQVLGFVIYKIGKAFGSFLFVVVVYATWVITPWCVTSLYTSTAHFSSPPPTAPSTSLKSPPLPL